MSYRDDHESARAAAERLERQLWQAQREIERLRARRSRAMPFLLASAFGLIAVSVAAMPRAEPPPPPPPAPTFAEPPPSPPPPIGASSPAIAGGLGALGSTTMPIPRFFQGTVTRAEGETQVKAGTGCSVSVRALAPVCLVSVTCGGYQPFPGTAFASCTFDSQGFPKGEMHFATPANSPTDLAMEGGRLTLADARASHESVVEITLSPVNKP
ncbi:MAG: hypothetical protein U0359_03705 [Byssovorax sp.]